jgi:hypothetical protein
MRLSSVLGRQVCHFHTWRTTQLCKARRVYLFRPFSVITAPVGQLHKRIYDTWYTERDLSKCKELYNSWDGSSELGAVFAAILTIYKQAGNHKDIIQVWQRMRGLNVSLEGIAKAAVLQACLLEKDQELARLLFRVII